MYGWTCGLKENQRSCSGTVAVAQRRRKNPQAASVFCSSPYGEVTTRVQTKSHYFESTDVGRLDEDKVLLLNSSIQPSPFIFMGRVESCGAVGNGRWLHVCLLITHCKMLLIYSFSLYITGLKRLFCFVCFFFFNRVLYNHFFYPH